MGKGFQDLQIWQRSKDLAVLIYRLTSKGQLAKDFGLRDQMRRAAVSIASNIAEGDERKSDKDAVRFFYISKGSIAELKTQNRIAFEIDYINEEDYLNIDRECGELGNMVGGIIRHRNNSL